MASEVGSNFLDKVSRNYLIIAVAAVALIVLILLISSEDTSMDTSEDILCGDGICSLEETCETCPEDCGGCEEIPTGPSPRDILLDLLPITDCGNLTDGTAYSMAIETGEDYCACILDEQTKSNCRQSLSDMLYYLRARHTYDPSVCESISDESIRSACEMVSGSGRDYVAESEQFWTLIYMYRANQNYDDLIPLLEEKLAEDPTNVELLIVASEAHADLSWGEEPSGTNSQKAESYARRAIEASPSDSRAHVALGYVLEARFDIILAIESYDRAVELDPLNAEAYVGRGHARRLISDPIAALEDFNKAKELDPERKMPIIYRNLCTMLSGQDEYIEEAIENCMILIDSPDVDGTSKAEAYNSMGSMYMRATQFDEAISSFETSLTYLPRDPNANVYLAMVSNILGDWEIAEERSRKAIEYDQNRAAAYYELSYALAGQNRISEAEQAALKAEELVMADSSLLPGSAMTLQKEIYVLLTNIYGVMGDSENEAKYDKLIEEESN
jgi:tetratricopeptide (TPR) repeat protein